MGPLEKTVYERLLESEACAHTIAIEIGEARHAVTNAISRLLLAGAIEKTGKMDARRNIVWRGLTGADTSDHRRGGGLPSPGSRRLKSRPGSTCGRRPLDLRTSKGEWAELLQQCFDHGIGCQTISRLTGYSYGVLNQMARDFGLERNRVTVDERAQLFLSILPEDTQSLIRRIKTRSYVAHERHKATLTQAVARQVHYLMDEVSDICSNVGGPVRPVKEAA
jgi:hypothetical protein